MSKPNILWICTDQQRYDTISSLGNPHIRTPNIDRLVSEGTAFTHAFCQNPVCTPSRASFLTGRYPRTTRARQNGQCIPADEVLITRILADAGYDCGLAGKLHLSACCRRVEQRIDDGYRVFHWSHHPHPTWPENAYIQWLESKGYKWADVYHPPQGKHAFAGVPAELHQTTWCFDRAIEFISEERQGPWLMSINCFDPHHAFNPPKEYLDRYDPDTVPDPKYRPGELDNKPFYQRIDHDGAYGGKQLGFSKMTPRERREVTAAYYAMIELIDDNVGRILRMLDDTGRRENTIVIFMSDHGEMLGDHGIYLKGPFMYDCAVRVPLIISWPGPSIRSATQGLRFKHPSVGSATQGLRFESGLRSDALVELVDLAPTLLEACDLPVPSRMQGRSFHGICTALRPFDRLRAQDEAGSGHRDFVFAEYYSSLTGHERCEPDAFATMIRTRTHKLVAYHGLSEGELYDLDADPDEFDNLWSSPAYSDIRFDLMKQCFDASVFTMDPIPERVAPW